MPTSKSVMLLISDDWSPIAGCYGNDVIQTPKPERPGRGELRIRECLCQPADLLARPRHRHDGPVSPHQRLHHQ